MEETGETTQGVRYSFTQEDIKKICLSIIAAGYAARGIDYPTEIARASKNVFKEIEKQVK